MPIADRQVLQVDTCVRKPQVPDSINGKKNVYDSRVHSNVGQSAATAAN